MGPKARLTQRVLQRALGRDIASMIRPQVPPRPTARSKALFKAKQGTKTKTKTTFKRKSLFHPVAQQESGIVTNSFTVIPQKGNGGQFKKYAEDRLIPTLNYRSQDYDVIEQNGGFQAMNGTSAKLNHAGFYESTLLPLVVQHSNSTVYGTTGNLMVFESSQELNFTNQSNATCKYQIWDVVNRTQAHESTALNDPIAFWFDQSKKEDASATTTVPYSVGATPLDCRAWCQQFKVIKITTGFLTPGQTHKHIQKAEVNHVFTRDSFVVPGCFAKKTSHCFMIAEGIPVTEDTGAVVSTAPVTVIQLRKFHYDLKLIPSYKDVNHILDNLSTLTTPYVIPLENAKAAVVAI